MPVSKTAEPRRATASAVGKAVPPAKASSAPPQRSEPAKNPGTVKAGTNLAGPKQDTFTRTAKAYANEMAAAVTTPNKPKPAEEKVAKRAEQPESPKTAKNTEPQTSKQPENSNKPAEGQEQSNQSAGNKLQQLLRMLRAMGLDQMADQIEQRAAGGKGGSENASPAGGGPQASPANAGQQAAKTASPVRGGGFSGVLSGGSGSGEGGAGGAGTAALGAQATGAASPVTTPGGPAGPISQEELERAAGGNQQIVATLQKVAQDPEGAKALRTALDKGTTFKSGQLAGNVVGLTESGGGRNPVVTLEDPSSVDTAAHEIAHAAYPDMPHEQVYMFGHQVAQNLGERVNNNGGVPPGIS